MMAPPAGLHIECRRIKVWTNIIAAAFIMYWAAGFLDVVLQQVEGAAICAAQDRAALLAFKAAVTGDPSGYLDTWKAQASKANCCSAWRGVTCDAATGRVTGLDLSDAGLRGTLSPSLGSLSKLQTLSLARNSFHGPIPSSLGNLSGLVTLALDSMVNGGDGGLTGAVPESFGRLAALRELDVSHNKLSGSLPRSIGGMSSLQQLNIINNSIGGRIPASFGQLSSLYYAYLSYNRLSGVMLDAATANLTNLLELYLEQNLITGLPKDLSNLPQLGIVALDGNPIGPSADRVSGLATLPFLGELHLSGCGLSGPFPHWIARLPGLPGVSDNITPLIDLSHNALSGPIPPELGHVAYMEGLGLDHNQLSGAIPASLGNLTSLRYVSLDHNQLTGSIPSTFVQLQGLLEFNVSYNHLSGEIPQQAPFTALDASSYQHNAGLCGSPLPPCTTPAGHHRRLLTMITSS